MTAKKTPPIPTPDTAAPDPVEQLPGQEAMFAETAPTPPTAKGSAPRKMGRPSKVAAAIEDRTRRVTAAYQQMGAMLMLAGLGLGNQRMMAAGEALESGAEQLGAAWAGWADTSPAVARVVDTIAGGGAAGAVLLAHLPIARALMSPADVDASGDLGSLLQMFPAEPPTS